MPTNQLTREEWLQKSREVMLDSFPKPDDLRIDLTSKSAPQVPTLAQLEQSREITQEINSPEYKPASVCRYHNWRNHVPAVILAAWDTLSHQTKVAVYIIAQEQANNEEWD